MTLKKIVIVNSRVHNLKNVSCEIPKNAFTVVTGPSGSGKSSLVFDTIYKESQRRFIDSLSSYSRYFLGQFQAPDVDSKVCPPLLPLNKNPLLKILVPPLGP